MLRIFSLTQIVFVVTNHECFDDTMKTIECNNVNTHIGSQIITN